MRTRERGEVLVAKRRADAWEALQAGPEGAWQTRTRQRSRQKPANPWGPHLLIAWAPFSSPFTVASPFFGGLGWETAAVAAAGAAVAADAVACCWASFSRKACCRVCTTSGITASIRDRDSMGRPSNTVPSWGELGDSHQLLWLHASWMGPQGTSGRPAGQPMDVSKEGRRCHGQGRNRQKVRRLLLRAWIFGKWQGDT